MVELAQSCIAIIRGKVIDPLNPDPDVIQIEDIAEVLSNQCRFSGHLNQRYSVAEHSVRCSLIVPKEDAKEALMHDASEYLLTDFASPLKHALFAEKYRTVENQIMTVIAEKFGFRWPVPESVVWADNALLMTEHRDLMDKIEDPEIEHALWDRWFFAEYLPETIVPMTDKQAMEAFMIRYHVLFDRS